MCIDRQPSYLPHSEGGIIVANSKGDGYTIAIEWTRAYPDSLGYSIAYNIYYSTIDEDVFKEGVKFVSSDPSILRTEILDLTPGDVFYFAVRATEYDPSWYNLSLLPSAGSTYMYPSGLLTANISASDGYLPLSDIDQFPPFGVVKVGSELIRYLNRDLLTGRLLNLTRGFLDTEPRLHTIDGYDGYVLQIDPSIHFWTGFEDPNEVIFQETSHFLYPNYARTAKDGYRAVLKDILTTDLGASDASQANFPSYDYSGWHRTDPVALLRGDCIGTYYGGEQFCADGYLGVGRQVRGVPIQEENDRRQEVLLDATGEPCVLVRRAWTGIRCSCYYSFTEYPEERCPICFNTSFITGYQQFFNPKRSDGRIMIRFTPTEDDLKLEDAGLESTFLPSVWTIVYPAIKDRDFIIRFNEDNTEEFRYEVLSVTRNKLFLSFSGRQDFKLQRVRKTDPIYQWRAIRDTSTMPQKLSTSIGLVPGPGGILPHTHQIVINEKISSVSQINQTTSYSQGHNHPVINGIVVTELGHSHTIILP